jgi:hypothetical protein
MTIDTLWRMTAMQTNMLESKNRFSELVKCGAASGRDILGWLARNPLPAHARRSPEEIAADIQREREEWS